MTPSEALKIINGRRKRQRIRQSHREHSSYKDRKKVAAGVISEREMEAREFDRYHREIQQHTNSYDQAAFELETWPWEKFIEYWGSPLRSWAADNEESERKEAFRAYQRTQHRLTREKKIAILDGKRKGSHQKVRAL